MTTQEPTRPVGRPTKYREEYIQQMIDFFSRAPTEERFKSRVKDADKGTKVTHEGGGIDFPSFTRFALKIGVYDGTLVEWCNEHKDFSIAYEWCKKLQEDVWRVNSLNGNYSANFAIFLGKNVYGYKDKTEVDNNHTVNMMPSVKIGGKEVEFDVGEEIEKGDSGDN